MMSENRASIRQGLLPDKIRSTHRDRLAIVYIRQSTPQQIERHQESGSEEHRNRKCTSASTLFHRRRSVIFSASHIQLES